MLSRLYKDSLHNFSDTHDQSIMKTLLCGLAAILSVAVSSPVLAISDDGLITGTVVEYTEINAPHYALVVEDSKKERFTINATLANSVINRK
jgi:hypothetical protein